MKVLFVVVPVACFVMGFMTRGMFLGSEHMPVGRTEYVESADDKMSEDTAVASKHRRRSSERSTTVVSQGALIGSMDNEFLGRLSRESVENVETLASKALFKELVQQDPAYAAEVLNSMEEELQQEHLHDVLESWSTRDPLKAYEWAKMNAGVNASYQLIPLRALADQEPEDAVKFVGMIDDKDQRGDLALAVAAGWAKKDVDQAFKFLEDLSSFDVSAEVLSQSYSVVVNQFAVTDPAGAAQIVQKLAPGPLQEQLLDPVIENFAKEDYKSALKWAVGLGAVESSDVGVNLLIDRCSDQDQPLLLEAVLANQGALRPSTIAKAVWKAGGHDPESTSRLLQQIDVAAQPNVVSLIALGWLDKDVDAAIQWVGSLSDNALYEAGVRQVAYYLKDTEPAVALECAASLSDDNVRDRMMRNIVERADAKELEHLLAVAPSLSLSGSERGMLTGIINRQLNSKTASFVLP